jgi:hypothetical protein
METLGILSDLSHFQTPPYHLIEKLIGSVVPDLDFWINSLLSSFTTQVLNNQRYQASIPDLDR